MFIRVKKKRNKRSKKEYKYLQLVESYRTPEGPRQRLLLNLGELELPEEKYPLLVGYIKNRVYGQCSLFEEDAEIAELADKYANKLLIKYEHEPPDSVVNRTETIYTESISDQRTRTVGAEHLGYSYFKRLHIDECLRKIGFTSRQIEIATLLVINRLVATSSERKAYYWARNLSGLDELMGTSFQKLSLNSLYNVSDLLLARQDVLEQHLRERERDMFGLQEKIILYDLTNMHFEGMAAKNPKAKFGRSKKKRSDCRLVTLGLVVDGNGFPKRSKMFPGNQNEAKSLKEMIEALRAVYADPLSGASASSEGQEKRCTIVVDAGIATEKNLEELKKDYDYICVSRKRMDPPETDTLIKIKEDKNNKVYAHMTTLDDEVFMYCQSDGKRMKEKGIQSRSQQFFEQKLEEIKQALHKKGGTKKYNKVWERIGRAKEKYQKIARYYTITVEEEHGTATNMSWEYTKEDEADKRFSGSYYIRTNRTDLEEKQLWSIYTMLTDLEEAFRSLNSDLNIRPNYHQTEPRSDGHIFITILAYHILHSIRTNLKSHGLKFQWKTIRDRMASHTRGTTRCKTVEDKMLYVRKCSDPEPFHKMIYKALNLHTEPRKKIMFKL